MGGLLYFLVRITGHFVICNLKPKTLKNDFDPSEGLV